MKRRFFLPAKPLRKFVDRYWMWEGEPDEKLSFPEILSGTGAELFFHFYTPFSIPDKNRTLKRLPNSHLICPRDSVTNISPGSRTGFISIRFRSAGLYNFSPFSVEELKNKFYDIKDIWSKEDLKGITDEIDPTYPSKIVEQLDSFLLKLLTKFEKGLDSINRSIDYIYYNFDKINIQNISQTSQFSRRHFQRKFKEVTGVSPKAFHKTARFQKILKNSLLNQRIPDLKEIIDSGYYDQSHFLKDFRYFTRKTPSEYFKEKLKMSHFYNTSIPPIDRF